MTRKFFVALALILAITSLSYAEDTETKVLARVGGQDITEADVFEFIKPFGQQAVMLYGSEEGRKMILEDVITMRLYSLLGKDEKVDETPEFIADFENAKRAMLAQYSMRKIISGIDVSDDDAKKFYDDNAKLFIQPERVHARHILVSDDENLKVVQEELKAGKSFDVVAEEHSIDPGSASNGGDLGEFPKGVMVKEFEGAAFALQNPGDVSEPVKSQFGWHIIKLEERIPESTVPFEQVKAHIIEELRNRKTQEVLQEKSKELEEKYTVERF